MWATGLSYWWQLGMVKKNTKRKQSNRADDTTQVGVAKRLEKHPNWLTNECHYYSSINTAAYYQVVSFVACHRVRSTTAWSVLYLRYLRRWCPYRHHRLNSPQGQHKRELTADVIILDNFIKQVKKGKKGAGEVWMITGCPGALVVTSNTITR